MSHHSEFPDDSPLRRSIAQQLAKERLDASFQNILQQTLRQPLIGATGTSPEGQLTPHDEGALQFAVGVRDGKVCLDFGQPVAWIGMNPGDALQLAQSLIEQARKAAKGTGSILTLNI